MAEDFNSAAIRHWTDANSLNGSSRFDNADHLVGFAVECAIKSALNSAGLLDRLPNGRPKIGHLERGRSSDAWQQARALPLSPTLLVELNAGNPFSNWKAEQRYDSTGSITALHAQTHIDAARRVLVAAGVIL